LKFEVLNLKFMFVIRATHFRYSLRSLFSVLTVFLRP